MKRILYFLMVLFLAIVFFTVSCGDRDVNPMRNPSSEGGHDVLSKGGDNEPLRPIFQHPLPGEPIDKKFMLVFDRKVLFPSEVSFEDYIKTDPPLKGYAECVGNTITFDVLQDLPKDVKEIKFCVNPQLQSERGVRIDENSLCYLFPMEGLKVVDGRFEDVDGNRFVFVLVFNHAVVMDEVKPFILLTDKNGKLVEFKMREGGNNTDVIELEVGRSADEPYKMLIKPGYMDSEKRYKGKGACFEFPLSEPLKIVNCKREGYNRIQIVFSRPVLGNTLYKYVGLMSKSSDRVDFYAVPADWGAVMEPAFLSMSILDPAFQEFSINNLGVLFRASSAGSTAWEKIVGEKVSKSWILSCKDESFSSQVDHIIVKQYMCSKDFSILPEEFKWVSRTDEQEFRIDYAYWENKGLDGVSCIVRCSSINYETALNYLEITPPVDNLSLHKREWNDIEIKGNWKTGVNYVMKWKAGLEWGITNEMPATGGYKVLSKDYTYSLRNVPEYKTLAFGNEDKFYIIPFQEKNFVRVESRNVPKGYLHIYRVVPENLSVWIGNVSGNDVPFDINERTTKYVKSIPVDFPDSVDKACYVDVNLTEHLKDFSKGIFTLYLSDRSSPGQLMPLWELKEANFTEDSKNKRRWEDYYDYGDESSSDDKNRFYLDDEGVRSSICYVLWTRLGIVSHWDAKSLIVFVHDLLDLTPQAGAVVSAYSIKNRKIGEGTTGDNGILKMTFDDKEWGSPYLLTVQTEKDFTFMFLVPKPLPTMKDLEKYDRYDKESYDAFVYADRNLYRPGETIHSRWIVRTNYGSEVVNAPLELRFVNPQNKVVLRRIVNLSEWGTGGDDILIGATYLTGNYSLGLYVPGGDRLCGSTVIHVEDFVPDQIKTELETGEDFWIVGSNQSIESVSHYFVGPPASDLKCKWKLIITKKEFESEKWKGYRFGNDEPYKTVVMDLAEQKTDNEGRAKQDFVFSPTEKVKGPIEIAVVSEVLEAGGRAVSAVKRVKGYPDEVLCGVNVEKVDDKLQVNVALVDKNFEPAGDKEVEVFLERVDWSYVNRVYEGRFRNVLPEWQRVFTVIEQKKTSTVNGKAIVHFNTPTPYFSYRIRAQRAGSEVFSDTSFYYTPFKVVSLKNKPPELVKIHTEDKKWFVGEVASLNIEVPFDGKAIAVVQGDHVWDGQVIDIVSGKGTFSIPIKEEYFPNVWVGVSAIHVPSKGEMEISPYSTFSFTKLEVEKPERKLQIVFPDLPVEVKPQTAVDFSVQVTDVNKNPVVAELTVALVDEGIHSIGSYTSPDPYMWFGRPRYSPIRRVHYYEYVAYDYEPLSAGGDMIARQLSAGKPEIGETWIKPVALWSGVLKTNEQGIAKTSFNLPEFNGKLRIVAVGVNEKLVGSVESSLFVRRPCVIQTQLPRFLRPNDKAILFARSLNSRDIPLNVKVSLVPNDVIQVSPLNFDWKAQAQGLTVSPEINLTCVSASKNITLEWQYEVLDEQGNVIDRYSRETPIPNRIPSMYEQRRTVRMIPATEALTLDTSEFVVNDLLQTDIKVGGSPLLQVEPALQWLWDYPYSCCEQKVSRLYGLYLFRDFIQNSMKETINREQYHNLLLTLVDDVFTHQQANGGLSLWPYSNSTDMKTSLHTAFLLALIKREKILLLPEKPYQRLMAFVQDVCIRDNYEHPVAYEAQVFASLILAVDGDPSACERLESYLKLDMPRSLRTLLLLGASLCGKPAEFIIPYVGQLAWETEQEEKKNTYEFSSPRIRLMALKLISKVLSNSSLEEMIECQKPLLEYVSKSYGYTTYEMSFVLMALEMSFKKMGVQPQECVAKIKINNQEEDIRGIEIFSKKIEGTAQVEIQNKGISPLFVVCDMRGIPINPPLSEESKHVKLQRTLYNRNKGEVTDNVFSQGDIYTVVFVIEPESNVDNFVLTQLLPAGLEIENPRLTIEVWDEIIPASFKNSYSGIQPEHLEVRDDKLIVAFPPLQFSNKYIYVCCVRAVTKGTFEFPGARIEDMYNPEIFARLSTQRIEVK